MRRINLAVSEDLRKLTVTYAALRHEGIVARGAANAINAGCSLLESKTADEQIFIINSLKEIYRLLKIGRQPKIVIYLDIIDRRKFERMRVAHGLHPKSLGYRMMLGLGLVCVSNQLQGEGASSVPLLTHLRRVSDLM